MGLIRYNGKPCIVGIIGNIFGLGNKPNVACVVIRPIPLEAETSILL